MNGKVANGVTHLTNGNHSTAAAAAHNGVSREASLGDALLNGHRAGEKRSRLHGGRFTRLGPSRRIG